MGSGDLTDDWKTLADVARATTPIICLCSQNGHLRTKRQIEMMDNPSHRAIQKGLCVGLEYYRTIQANLPSIAPETKRRNLYVESEDRLTWRKCLQIHKTERWANRAHCMYAFCGRPLVLECTPKRKPFQFCFKETTVQYDLSSMCLTGR
jgi:hypothetical protein